MNRKELKGKNTSELLIAVPIIPTLHGTALPVAEKICESGFAALSSVDAGYSSFSLFIFFFIFLVFPFALPCVFFLFLPLTLSRLLWKRNLFYNECVVYHPLHWFCTTTCYTCKLVRYKHNLINKLFPLFFATTCFFPLILSFISLLSC